MKDNMQEALTSGTKVDAMDIYINEDRIIIEDLVYVKEHLTESVWSFLNKESREF